MFMDYLILAGVFIYFLMYISVYNINEYVRVYFLQTNVMEKMCTKKLILNDSYWSNSVFWVQIGAFPAECAVNKC